MDINRFIQAIRRKKLAHTAVEGLIITSTTSSILLVFLSLFDYFFTVPYPVRFFFPLFVFSMAGFFIVRFIGTLYEKPEDIIREIQDKIPELKDSLINAWQLSNNMANLKNLGMSEELAAEHISIVTEKIQKLEHVKIIDFSTLFKHSTYLLPALFISLAFYLKTPSIISDNMSKFIFVNSGLDFEKHVEVIPGNAKLPLGSGLEILLNERTKNEFMESEPQVYVRSKDTGWRSINLSPSGTNRSFVSEKIHVVNDFEYYAVWKGLKSQKYLIECVSVPKAGDFRIIYHYPAYTGLKPKEGKMFGEIPVPVGTNIEFSATVNKKLKKASLATSYGKKIALSYKEGLVSKTIHGNLLVEDKGECWFELTPEDDVIDRSPAHYPIYVTKDKSPQVIILSPAQDLIVGQDVKVTIVFKASDDFGISAVELLYEINDIQKNILVKRYGAGDGNTEYTQDYDWDIAAINTKPGDKIQYFLKVADNDTITGPKYAYSEKYTLEIFSYEKEHAQIEEELKKFREDLLNVLGQEIEAKEMVDSMKRDSHTVTPEELNKAIAKQEKINKNTKDMVDKLQKSLDKMSADPYTNYQIYQEYKQIGNTMDYLSKNQMQQASNSLQQQKLDNAEKNINEVIDSLEKMNLLAEDVLQYQKMQDVLNSSDKLSELTDELAKGLEGPVDPQKKELLDKTLDKIDKLLQEINEALKKMPQGLPEDFINQQAVKDIDPGQMQNMSESIRSAMESGNMEQALAQAKKMLKQLEAMRDSMQKASKSVGFSSVDDGLNKKMREGLLELAGIISKQEQIFSETNTLETERQKKVLEEEDKILEQLAKKQREAINKTNNICAETSKVQSGQFAIGCGYHLRPSIPVMEKVYQELSTKKVVNSKDYLKEIIAQIGPAQNLINDYYTKTSTSNADFQRLTYIKNETADVKALEQYILDTLNKPIDIEPSMETMSKMADLSKRQGEVKGRTVKLGHTIQEMSRQSAAITPEILSRLGSASMEMGNAETNLNNGKINPALANEQKAIEYLTEGDSSMQGTQQTLGQMQGNFNQPMAGFMKTIPGKPGKQGSSGNLGARTGYVKLPGINEYLPPREFREEILKGLKENYPEEYDKIIKEYYNKLIKP